MFIDGHVRTEIVVEDPTAPADNSPSVVSTRTIEIVVSLLLLALAGLLCFDNWRTGSHGSGRTATRLLPVLSRGPPRAASLYGLVTSLTTRTAAATYSSRATSFAA